LISGLAFEDLAVVVDVEPEEVDQLTGGVDLGLLHVLRLTEHRRGVDQVASGGGDQFGGFEENRGALVPRQRLPLGFRLSGRGDRCLHLGVTGSVSQRQAQIVAVGGVTVEGVAGEDLLATDDTSVPRRSVAPVA
jgi:hypothetical protein